MLCKSQNMPTYTYGYKGTTERSGLKEDENESAIGKCSARNMIRL
jgi:predicted nucleic acid-binding Zn ribbon protein